MDFLSLLVSVHHPQGARFENEGARWEDAEAWKHCLRQMYSNLVETVIANRVAGYKKGSSSRVGASSAGDSTAKKGRHPLLFDK